MSIDVKYFLIGNGLILGVIVWSIYRGHKQSLKGPTRLNLKNGEKPKKKLLEGEFPSTFNEELRRQFRDSAKKSSRKSRELNLFFQFNGEQMDAYKVLDLPAGCSQALAVKRYKELKDDNSLNQSLLERAMLEIQKRD